MMIKTEYYENRLVYYNNEKGHRAVKKFNYNQLMVSSF